MNLNLLNKYTTISQNKTNPNLNWDTLPEPNYNLLMKDIQKFNNTFTYQNKNIILDDTIYYEELEDKKLFNYSYFIGNKEKFNYKNRRIISELFYLHSKNNLEQIIEYKISSVEHWIRPVGNKPTFRHFTTSINLLTLERAQIMLYYHYHKILTHENIKQKDKNILKRKIDFIHPNNRLYDKQDCMSFITRIIRFLKIKDIIGNNRTYQ